MAVGCGGGDEGSDQLRSQLDALPISVGYHEVAHSGDGDVLGGTATDSHGESVHFVLSIGDTHYQDPGERLPDGTVANRGGGKNFGWWIDSNRKAPHEVALARERIAEQLIQTLCRTATGVGCGV
jgi:hypothetical protein